MDLLASGAGVTVILVTGTAGTTAYKVMSVSLLPSNWLCWTV